MSGVTPWLQPRRPKIAPAAVGCKPWLDLTSDPYAANLACSSASPSANRVLYRILERPPPAVWLEFAANEVVMCKRMQLTADMVRARLGNSMPLIINRNGVAQG